MKVVVISMKLKKYKGTGFCECSIGFDDKRYQVILCKNKAVYLYFPDDRPTCIAFPVCEKCWDNGKLNERIKKVHSTS